MIQYCLFIFWWIIFVSPAEFLINAVILPWVSLQKFGGAIATYIFLLTIYYLIRWRKIYNRIESESEKIIEAIILGSFGLFIIEWWLIGNSPTGNPDAGQLSMFIWWIFLYIFPKIMTFPRYRSMRKSILIYQILYSILFYLVVYITKIPLAGIVLYSYGLLMFYIFFVVYLRKKYNITTDQV